MAASDTRKQSDFDETWYLKTYPDVALAVERGHFASGYDHYCQRGKHEGRGASAEFMRLERQKVLTGRDGWLFLNNDTNDVTSQIKGTYVLPEDFDNRWKDVLSRRQAHATKNNYKYLFTVAPNKECVYFDKLPDDIVVSDERPIVRIREISSSILTERFIYPIDRLIEAKQKCETYPKGDTHWTFFGSLIFSNSILEALGMGLISETDITVNYKRMPGDLSSKLGIDTETSIGEHKNKSFRITYSNNIPGIGQIQKYETTNKELPSCIVFRDSFTNTIKELIAQSFSKLTLIWSPDVDFNIIESERPDIVITEQAERFLVRVPKS